MGAAEQLLGWTMWKILWEPGGEAPTVSFRKDSGKIHTYILVYKCVHACTHTHTIMLGGLGMPPDQ